MTPVMTDINLYYIKFMLLISDIFLSRWSNQVSGRRNMRLNDFKSTSVSVSFSLAHAASLFLSSWLMWHWGGQACHTSSGSYGVTQQTSRAQKWSGPSLPVGVSLFFLFLLQSTDRLRVMMEVMRSPMILLCDIFFYSSSVSLCLIKYSTAISGAALSFLVFF